MWENKKTQYGIHYSRYIASWNNAGGPDNRDLFIEWLRSECLSDDEIADIIEMWFCGKMELEHSVERFLESKNLAKEAP